MPSVRPILLADIGATNARFALLRDSDYGPIEHTSIADHPTALDAIAMFLARHARGTPVTTAILGVAGVIDHGHCVITNSGWTLDADELRAAFGLGTVRLRNDFEALAWSVPDLTAIDLFAVRRGQAVVGAPVLLVSPDTGFGVSCLLSPNDRGRIVASEAAHSTPPAALPEDDALIDILRTSLWSRVRRTRALRAWPPESRPSARNASRQGDASTRRRSDSSSRSRRKLRDLPCNARHILRRARHDRRQSGTDILRTPRRLYRRRDRHAFPEYLGRSDFAARFSAKGRGGADSLTA